MSNKLLKVEEIYLKELVGFCSRSLAGKVMKRFEILEDKQTVKDCVKELIYESYREFLDLLYAYNQGLEVTQFKFVRPEKKPTE